jgi:HEAT repeat protein
MSKALLLALSAVVATIAPCRAETIEQLIESAKSNLPETQIAATDGLVDHYLPGYIKTGLSGMISKAGTAFKGKFTDVNTQTIAPWVQVRPDVIEALGRVATGGASFLARANAARAIGILRAKAALPQLGETLKSRDTQVLYECLIALQKIRDPNTAPLFVHLISDLDERIQMAAMETAGVLAAKGAAPAVQDVLQKTRNNKVRRMALTSLAMIGDPSSRPVFEQYFTDKDDQLRGSAAEGYGRMRVASDRTRIEQAFVSEKKTGPKLSLAFASALLGNRTLAPGTPISYLIDQLDSRFFHDTAKPFLVELARDPEVRKSLYPAIKTASKKEKIRLAQALAISGDAETVKVLEALSTDPDTEVAAEGLTAVRSLKALLGL